MAKQAVTWNKDKTKSVVLSKLKEFQITEAREDPPLYSVRGYFNAENAFMFGLFDSKQEAEDFLENIHKMF